MPPDSSDGSNGSTSLAEADERQEVHDALADLRLPEPGVLAQGIGDVLVDRQRIEERRALEDVAHPAAEREQLLFGQALDARPKRRMPPAVRPDQAAMSRSSTVLPEPLPPMTTRVSPLCEHERHAASTSVVVERFHTSITSTSGSRVLTRTAQEELGQEEVGHDHAHGHVDDGGRRRPPSPSVPPSVLSPL